jgi:hypothetical protein
MKMSKIKFKQINANEISVTLDSNVPLDMVEQLTKSLEAKGMIEDKVASSVTHRFFYKPESKANNIADELIKSLQSMSKGIDPNDRSNPYSKASQIANKEKNRINDRRAQSGSTPLTEAQIAANKAPKPPAPTTPATPNTSSGPRTLSGPNKLVGEIGFGGYSSTKKNEDDEDEDDIEKSNYGPKKGGQYSPVDNARRKANNLDPVEGIGPNTNTKAYSTKPGQMSGKAQADLSARIQAAANKKQPVKQWTPEEIEAENKKRGLKKSWDQHLPFPSAEEEIMKLAGVEQISGETAAANQLMNLMQGKQMLGKNLPASVKAMFAAPPAQPTDEQMFGHLVVTEEMVKAKEQEWQGAAFNWLAEAAKPITQKFASEAEEIAYWNSIKVADRDDGKSGY